MVKEKINKAKKKELRNEVSHQLEQVLGKLKEHLGEKKFHSRIKKAVRILTDNLGSPKTEKIEKKNTAPIKEKKEAKAEAVSEPAKPAPRKTVSVAAVKKSAPKKVVKKNPE